MRKIVLDYYSRCNFGDDMFAYIFVRRYSDQFKVRLFGNPFIGMPHELKQEKIKFTFSSYFATIISFIGAKYKTFANVSNVIYNLILEFTKNKSLVYVKIGGSIFMDKKVGEEIYFGADSRIQRVFENQKVYNYKNHPSSKSFIMGANLGPVYTEDYWSIIKNRLKSYGYVTLRDYSSYLKVSELENTHYAPDIGFLMPKCEIQAEHDSDTLVISVIYVENYTDSLTIIDKYYQLLSEICITWHRKGGHVILLSMCEKEGDMRGIERISSLLKPDTYQVINYGGNITSINEVFANSSFVICSRFHSLIMALLYNKPCFPISYNCKTENYLLDLNYLGKWSTLSSIKSISEEDLLSNYKNNYVCDCSEHIRYAENHFRGLDLYMNSLEI